METTEDIAGEEAPKDALEEPPTKSRRDPAGDGDPWLACNFKKTGAFTGSIRIANA